MSLYTEEEVCEGCRNAHFHKCCGSFCYCREDHKINGMDDTCDFKEEEE